MPGHASSVEAAVAAYGEAAEKKLSATAVQGELEDQLRNPLDGLFHDLAELCGLAPAKLALVGEASLADLKTRPDFAVEYADGLIGYVEVKAPGKGADPRRFRDPHDRQQWAKLRALPNLLYTDGNAFSLWRGGELVGTIQRLDGEGDESAHTGSYEVTTRRSVGTTSSSSRAVDTSTARHHGQSSSESDHPERPTPPSSLSSSAQPGVARWVSRRRRCGAG